MNIVITGGTRGIGLGLARAFLARGHRVVVAGRTPAGVAAALASLGEPARSLGVVADVRDPAALQSLGRVLRCLVMRRDPFAVPGGD